MGPADSRRITRVPRYSGYRRSRSSFEYRIITFYDVTFQILLLTLQVPRRGPTTPAMRCHKAGLGSSPVARHYWGNHCYFLFLEVLRCFSSPRWPLSLDRCHAFSVTGCPIRKSRGQGIFAPNPCLSQLITSFIASVSLGIRHTPFLTFFTTVFVISFIIADYSTTNK